MVFTIITVVLNGAKILQPTIDSIKKQKSKHFDIEYLIIDGGSTDGTVDLIKKNLDFVSDYVSEPDLGIYNAMNKGIRMATGDVVAFMNAGDWYEDGILEVVHDFFREQKADVVAGKALRVVDGIEFGNVFEITREDLEQLHLCNQICHQSMFIKRDLFLRLGLYDEQYKILADYDWNLRAYNAGASIKVIPNIVCHYDVSGISEIEDSSEESRNIALRNLNGRVEFLDKIEALYCEKKRFLKVIDNRDYIERKLKEKAEHYILYGVGIYGLKIYRLMKSMGIPVSFFLDKKRFGSVVDGIEIREPSTENTQEYLETHPDTEICITAIKYEKEMRAALQNLGVDEDRYFTLFEL